MNFRQTIRTCLLGLVSLALVSGVSSCNTKDEPKLQDVQLVNMQLERFGLVMKDNPSLSAVRFSIANDSPEGLVENVEPLPYGVQLDKVLLDVVPTTAVTKVEVALGETGEYADWSVEKEYQIANSESVLRLRLSLTTEQGATYEYKYRVQLRRYRFDPETIEWTEGEANGIPPSVADAYLYAQPRSEDLLVLRSGTQGSEYYSYKNQVFSPIQISGLDAGERIVQATSYGHTPYIYTSLGQVYRLQGGSWQQIPIGAEVKALLGVLAPRQSHLEPRLALIVKRDGKEVFASYADGQLSTRDLAVPEAFPRKDVYSFGANKTYVGSSLTLIGEATKAGVPIQSTWYTTGLAEDWLQVSQEERPDRQGARPSTVLMLGDMLYRLETVGGLSIYTSADRGRSWKKNGEKALPIGASSFAGKEIWGYSTSEHTIHLLRNVGVSSGGTMSLLNGRPKKYDL